MKDLLRVGKVPQAVDGVEVSLAVNLESYLGPGDSATHSAQRHIYLHSPSFLAELCPDLREIEGLLEVGRALSGHMSTAEGLTDPGLTSEAALRA